MCIQIIWYTKIYTISKIKFFEKSKLQSRRVRNKYNFKLCKTVLYVAYGFIKLGGISDRA